jgi:hypothetical protein
VKTTTHCLLIFCTVALMTGCTYHYHDIRADTVTLYLNAPSAGNVAFAASMDNFQVRQARRTGPGTWVVKVPSTVGFEYFYLIDGKPYLPDCKLRVADDFGAQNCVFDPDI